LSERTKKFRKKLAEGKLCPGIWISLACPMSAEIIADAGFDFILVDGEHNPFNMETLFHMLLAFRGSDTVPIIRVPWNNPVMIKQVLDMGFEGIVTPNTNNAEEARQAVSACRYPPMGTRGYGPTRPTLYGRDGGDYDRTANQQIFCAIQIESIGGAEDIENIVKVPGIDLILIGPRDMSGTVGVFGDVEHPELWKAMKKILKVAKAAGIPAGLPLDGPEGIRRSIKAGSQIFPISQDLKFLRLGVDDALKAFRKTIGEG